MIITTHLKIYKKLKILKLISAVFLTVTSLSYADGIGGNYKLAAVETDGEGWIGSVRVGSDRNFSGSVYNYYWGETIYLRGYVNQWRKLVFSPKPTDVTSISAKIRKRNKMVIGVYGTFQTYYSSGQIVGFKQSKL